ncbi:MAG TPA: hypothetical protein VF187_07945, partial [Gemmatimonadales bacterium]
MTRLSALTPIALVVPALLLAQGTPPARRGAPPARQGPSADSAGGGPGPRASQFGGLRFRSIGPAMTSGRIGEIAIHPGNRSVWYVAVHSGGVWKTV